MCRLIGQRVVGLVASSHDQPQQQRLGDDGEELVDDFPQVVSSPFPAPVGVAPRPDAAVLQTHVDGEGLEHDHVGGCGVVEMRVDGWIGGSACGLEGIG